MVKNYKLKEGSCLDCCLNRECEANKDNIIHFLMSNKILCENGKCIEVVESDED